jgi:AraC family transcriptional regulator
MSDRKPCQRDSKRAVWRVPGRNVLRTQSWAPITVQEVETTGGDGIWRNPRHRLSVVVGEFPDFAVRIDGAAPREMSGRGTHLVFCPAGATMRTRAGAMRWVQLIQEPDAWLALASQYPSAAGELAPMVDFDDPLIVGMASALAHDVEPGPAGRLLADALGTAIFVRILDRQGMTTALRRDAAPGLDAGRLQRVRDYVEANLSAELSLAELADVAGLSRFHFSRSFRRAAGIGVHRFVTVRRIERAKTLLKETDLSLAEIALAVGFQDQAAFTTRFRLSVGAPPGRFRSGGP